MKADRWPEIEELFHAALERKAEERSSFLQQHCVGDESLYSDVESLLNSYGKDDSFFEETASVVAAEMFGDVVGETIGPYEVLAELGSGGMGTVYLAQDVRLGRKIALKLLPPEFTNDNDRLRRFQQEARAASALNHPNILTVHEIEQRDELHYIATEFVDGATLRQRMIDQRMNLDEVLNIAIQVASALQAAHAAGIAHRDIKPENVMIRSDGYVKVLDFGLAKLTEVDDMLAATTPETNPGIVMGTPRYMSPEQARGLEVDARTDVFSLGIVIYEMVTGRVPFEGATTSDIIAALIKDEPQSMSLSVPELPFEFEQAVTKALEKDLAQRYQTIAEFSSDLQRLKNDLQSNAKLVRTNSDRSRVSAQNDQHAQPSTPGLGRSTDPRARGKTAPVRSNNSPRWAILLPSAAILLVLAGLILFGPFSARPRPLSSKGVESTHQLTNRDGFLTVARFAPDGKGVIYSAGFDGKPVELFFTDDVDGANTRSAGIESAALKSVSRNGKLAVLLNFELNWSDGFNGTLAIVPAAGGKPEVLMEGIDEAAFAPDGNTLAVVRTVMGGQQLEYPAGQVIYKSPGWMTYPRFSPQGDKIAFFEHPLGDTSGSLVVFDLASQKQEALSTDWQFLKGLAWNPKGDEIWFGGSRVSKKSNINAVSLSGQLRMDVYEVAGVHARVEDISKDGRMLITQGSNHSTMEVLEGESANEVVGSPFSWTTSADLSADGKTLLYYEWGYESKDRADVKRVYLRNLDRSENVELGSGKALALSPDGNWALALQTKSQPQLVMLSTTGGEPRTLPNRGIKEYHYASFFPDGRKILFTGVEARKDAEIRSYIQDLDTGQMHPLTEEFTVALSVSPDGKSVVIFQPDRSFYIQSLAGGQPSQIPGLESGDEPIQWSADSRDLYVKGSGEFATRIYRVNIATGKRAHWKDIEPPNKVGLVGLEVNPGGILVTPDGKVCVYTYWTLLQQLFTKPVD